MGRTLKEGWVDLCEEQGTEIWPLATHGKDGLYLTKKPYILNHREFYTDPVYQIWINDKRQVTMVRDEAYGIWERHMEEVRKSYPRIVQFHTIDEIIAIPPEWEPRECPFCGSTVGPHLYRYYPSVKNARYGVVCLDCAGTMDKGYCVDGKSAVDAWNRRPEDLKSELDDMLN